MRYLLSFFLFFVLSPAIAGEKVILQLKWEHQFQFAGYYAALWQGYYSLEGLDVEIKPASTPEGKLLNPVEEIASGRAQFAIGELDILLAKDKGEDLVILAPIFQRSPASLFALQSTPMANVGELAQLRIAAPRDNDTRAQIEVLLTLQGIDPKTVNFVEVPPNVDSLLAGLTDAIGTYDLSANFQALEKNISLKALSPSDYGLDFYGDSLYTSQSSIHDNPDRVDRFVRASLKGWQYALEHREEIAARIAKELPRHIIFYDDLIGFNQTFARQINDYLAFPYLQVGHNNPDRWYRMIDQLKSAGIIKGDWNEETLFRQQKSVFTNEYLLPAIGLGLGFIIFVYLYYLRHQKRILVPYMFILLGVILVEVLLESSFRKTQLNDTRLDVANQLSAISNRLSGSINRNLSVLNGLATHISINPSITQNEFERYASAVFQRETHLINLAAAPDLIVTLIYPYAPNVAVLGLDYRVNQAQREAVFKVKSSGEMAVTGPVNLVQGGVGFIGRTAVYIGDSGFEKSFWGVVSAVFFADEFYQSIGLLDPDLAIEIAIRGTDRLGNTGKVFYGQRSIFDDKQSIITNVSVGDEVWQMVAKPKQGWNVLSQDIRMLRASSLVLLIMLMLVGIIRFRQMNRENLFQDKIRQSETLLQQVGKLALIGGWKILPGAQSCQLSPQAAKILGLQLADHYLLIDDITSVFSDEDTEGLRSRIEIAFKDNLPFDIEVTMRSEQESQKWVRLIGNPQKTPDGGCEVVGAILDITERKQYTEVIQQQATFDLLTGLPNRFLFENRLNQAITSAQRYNRKLAVLFIDLDNFKPVNDNLGHKAGDELLKQVGSRAAACIRESDTVARYSGDEFTIILHDLETDSTSLQVAENILKSINLPFDIDGNQIFCSASIGISIYPDDGESGGKLVSNADHAMYEVKKSGRNDWHYFTESMQEESEKKHVLRSKLTVALAAQQLDVHYQPIIDLSADQVTKCEALVRWTDDEGNFVPTVDFIQVAEETGMINEIDLFVLSKATRFLIEQNQKLDQSIGLSVNVSPRLFSAQDKSLNIWLDIIRDAAKELEITVEITERLLTEDSVRALEALEKLVQAGVAIAIDDFGTGYSSLSYLTIFPIDIIKIDRSFIKNIGEDHTTEILTDAIISLARELELKVVAEGVETEAQLQFLRERNCEYAQGYLLGRPQDEQSFINLLTSEK